MIIGAHARGHVPAQARARRRRGAAAAGRGAERRRLRQHLVQRPQGRDRRASQASSATASRRSCAPSPGANPSTGSVNVDGKDLSRRALLQSSAYMPADRLTEGLMTEPERARERRADRARLAQVGALHQPPPRDRGGRARALRAGRQGAIARGARLGALGRQPAEGRDGARDALQAGHPGRRRADAGRRRRRARRDLPHPPRGERRRRARRPRLERRPGARGPVRPRDRDVARPRGRDARGRRRDRGEDHPRGDQRDDAHRRADGASAERLVEVLPLHRGRLRPRLHPRGGDDRPRRVRAGRTTAAISRTSTSRPSCSPARRSASSRWARRSP